MNDYRAGERTFQLLTQAAGRAGRSGRAGEVVIQTYDPEHYSIVHAARQDYKGFYEEEILYREMLAYPPAAHMLAVLVVSPAEESGRRLAEEIGGLVQRMAGIQDSLLPGHGEAKRVAPGRAVLKDRLHVIGPAPASVGKINDSYRFMLYVKHEDYARLVEVKNRIEDSGRKKKTGKNLRRKAYSLILIR